MIIILFSDLALSEGSSPRNGKAMPTQGGAFIGIANFKGDLNSNPIKRGLRETAQSFD